MSRFLERGRSARKHAAPAEFLPCPHPERCPPGPESGFGASWGEPFQRPPAPFRASSPVPPARPNLPIRGSAAEQAWTRETPQCSTQAHYLEQADGCPLAPPPARLATALPCLPPAACAALAPLRR